MQIHGGQLQQAVQRFNIPSEQWLDLSTGINPNGWAVPIVPASVWSRLPEDEDGLISAAQQYYECESLQVTAGSQAAIQVLPYLRSACRVVMAKVAYSEHALAWRRAGHQVFEVAIEDLADWIERVDVCVVINPNNPTADFHSKNILLQWQQQLSVTGGWLVVDEAFVDTTPEYSLISSTPRQGLIVLRSLGKFFGLAGIRVGFVMAEAELLGRLQQQLGIWSISNPARWVAQQALQDRTWQKYTRQQLLEKSQRLGGLLQQYKLNSSGQSSLFHWVKKDDAERIYLQLAQQGVLVRLFAQPSSLRFGLPKDSDWEKLERALKKLEINH